MGWSYRIRKRTVEGLEWYDVVEFYDTPPVTWIEDSIAPGGESREGVIECLEMMLADARKYETVVEKEDDL